MSPLTITGTGAGVAPSLDSAAYLNGYVKAAFSEPMTADAAFLLAASYTVTPLAGGDAVSVVGVTAGPGTNPEIAYLLLSAPITPDSLYELEVSASLKDAAGNAMDAGGLTVQFLWDAPDEILESIGLIQAILDALGEQDTEIGGHRLTRLTTPASAGDTTIYVDATEGWPEAGYIGIDGVRYSYSEKTATAFLGIAHRAAGAEVSGCAIGHRDDSPVVDVSGEWSALEQLRRALLVAYAEGDDLSVIGRNLGVNRLPIFRTDDQFRAVIQAMAYNPRGTVYGLLLALDSIAGSGNYEVYEDLLQTPNTVTIRLSGGAVTEEVSEGKAFLESLEYDALGGSQDEIYLPAGSAPITIQGVALADLGEVFDVRSELPSNLLYDYYPGAASPGQAFDYIGDETEVNVVSFPGKEYMRILTVTSGGTALYEMDGPKGARIVPETEVLASFVVRFPSGHNLVVAEPNQVHLIVEDGNAKIGVGFKRTLVSSPTVGLYAPGATVNKGATQILGTNFFYEITLRKRGEDWVELYVNGNLLSRVAYSEFPASTNHRIEFGVDPVSGTREVFFKQIALNLHTPKDFWADKNPDGIVYSYPNQKKFDANITNYFKASDVGKRLDIYGSGVTNGLGGNNNGSWLIESLQSTPGQIAILVGIPRTGAVLSSANPTRIVVPKDHPFKYPDDLGKRIVLENSSQGNDGEYVIGRLLKEGTFESLRDDFDSVAPQTTTICECPGESFVSEVGVDWHLLPYMTYETGISGRLSDAGDLSGETLTLRTALWENDLIMAVRYSDVLSAQVLADVSVLNTVIQDDPDVLYEYYPFYIHGTWEVYQAYLTAITAAGVIPEFEIV